MLTKWRSYHDHRFCVHRTMEMVRCICGLTRIVCSFGWLLWCASCGVTPVQCRYGWQRAVVGGSMLIGGRVILCFLSLAPHSLRTLCKLMTKIDYVTWRAWRTVLRARARSALPVSAEVVVPEIGDCACVCAWQCRRRPACGVEPPCGDSSECRETCN